MHNVVEKNNGGHVTFSQVISQSTEQIQTLRHLVYLHYLVDRILGRLNRCKTCKHSEGFFFFSYTEEFPSLCNNH